MMLAEIVENILAKPLVASSAEESSWDLLLKSDLGMPPAIQAWWGRGDRLLEAWEAEEAAVHAAYTR